MFLLQPSGGCACWPPICFAYLDSVAQLLRPARYKHNLVKSLKLAQKIHHRYTTKFDTPCIELVHRHFTSHIKTLNINLHQPFHLDLYSTIIVRTVQFVIFRFAAPRKNYERRESECDLIDLKDSEPRNFLYFFKQKS